MLVRDAKPARDFRNMCAEIRAYRGDDVAGISVAGMLARDKMIGELKTLGEEWAKHSGPVTDYRARHINIAKLAGWAVDLIPWSLSAGKVIEALLTKAGLDEISLGKVLQKGPRMTCELFLCDLYQAPSKPRANA